MAVKRQVLRDEVQAMILEGLTEGRWRPGARLSIDGLARELEVSPTPVREALVGLERSGLIEYRALRGFVVAEPLSPEQIGELIDAREVIERAALTRALAQGHEELLARLEAAHREQLAATERIRAAEHPPYELIAAYFEADSRFHDAFFEQADNPFLTSMHDSLGAHAHRMRQTWTEGPEGIDADEALTEHEEILRRVREHHHDGALRALERHLENVRGRSGGLPGPIAAAPAGGAR